MRRRSGDRSRGAGATARAAPLAALLPVLLLSAGCGGGGIATLINRGDGSTGGTPTPRALPVDVVAAADLRHDGVAELFALTVAGDPPVLLSPELIGGAAVLRFALAPDGARVAFLVARTSPVVEELWIADLRYDVAPSKAHPDLGDGQRVRDFAWSPDSTRLAFVGDLRTAGVPQLFTTAADGSDQRLALPDAAGPVAFAVSVLLPGSRAAFHWSPDSRHLACATLDPAQPGFALWIVDAEATAPRRLAPSQGSSLGLPMGRAFELPWLPFEWAPGAAQAGRIAYLVERSVTPGASVDPPGHELCSIALDGSDERRLSQRHPPGEPPPDVLRFAFSPDGSRIAYATTGRDPARVELWCSDPATTAPDLDATRISKRGASGAHDVLHRERDAFAWSPDSQRIAFRGDLETSGLVELYVADPTLPPSANDRINTQLRLPGQRVAAFAWSPDSQRLAYVANEFATDTFELFCARADGSSLFVVSRSDASADEDVLFAADPAAPGFAVDQPSLHWSPDSQRLAWLADGALEGSFEAWSALPDGVDRFRVNGVLPDPASDACRIAWRGASELLYVADQRSAGRFELFGARVDGPTGVVLTDDAGRGATLCPNFVQR